MPDTRIPPSEIGPRLEILNLFAKYCHAVDLTDWSMFPEVFTEDVVADYSAIDEYTDDKAVLHGLSELTSWFETSMAQIGPGLTHFMTNHLIRFSDGGADVVSHNHVLNVGMGGVYHTRIRPTPDGWRIAHLRFEVRYFAGVIGRLNATMTATDGRTL